MIQKKKKGNRRERKRDGMIVILCSSSFSHWYARFNMNPLFLFGWMLLLLLLGAPTNAACSCCSRRDF
jgi:hypothetical protein